MEEAAETDKRVLRSKEAVLRSAFEVLCEVGLSGLSIDEVSARSGVAKTTLYRHWPSRASLVLDACSQMGSVAFTDPDTGSLRGDLVALGREIARLFALPQATILPSILDAAERDAEMAGVFAVSMKKIADAYRTVLARAIKRRELPRNTDVEEHVAALVGPLAYRRWFERRSITDAFVKRIVDRATGGR